VVDYTLRKAEDVEKAKKSLKEWVSIV